MKKGLIFGILCLPALALGTCPPDCFPQGSCVSKDDALSNVQYFTQQGYICSEVTPHPAGDAACPDESPDGKFDYYCHK